MRIDGADSITPSNSTSIITRTTLGVRVKSPMGRRTKEAPHPPAE